METITCKTCNKEFSVYPSHAHRKHCSMECRRNKDYRQIDKNGYTIIKVDNKFVYEHRNIISKLLGRELTSKEHVHHKDDNRQNNNISNLELLTASEHISRHRTGVKDATKYIFKFCSTCGVSFERLKVKDKGNNLSYCSKKCHYDRNKINMLNPSKKDFSYTYI